LGNKVWLLKLSWARNECLNPLFPLWERNGIVNMFPRWEVGLLVC
jgi:hypothetical protein